jgi:hypothetical protein
VQEFIKQSTMANIGLDLPDRNDIQKWFKEAVYDWMSDMQKRKKIKTDEINESIQYLTRDQVASTLNISLVTLGKREKEGLPFKRIGRRKIYNPADVKKFIDQVNKK